MLEILRLIPGILVVLLGVTLVLNDLPQPLSGILWLIFFLAMIIGFIYAMIKFKKFRIIALVLLALFLILGFTLGWVKAADIMGKIFTFAVVLIYFFLIRD